MTQQTLCIASDHRGFLLKSILSALAQGKGYEVIDLGTHDESSCDASDFAQKLAETLRKNPEYRGVLICGSGQAMTMTANRYQNIRAALCTDTTMARLAREHNDANILVLGAGIIGTETAIDCFEVFFSTKFLEGRFTPRRQKLTDLGGL